MPSITVVSSTPGAKMDNTLRPHQDELLHLGELAGIYMDAKVFRIVVELLNMGIDTETIFNLLKTIRRSTIQRRTSYSTKARRANSSTADSIQ